MIDLGYQKKQRLHGDVQIMVEALAVLQRVGVPVPEAITDRMNIDQEQQAKDHAEAGRKALPVVVAATWPKRS